MYAFQLQRYQGINSRHRCPACQHRRKTFSLYINTETNQPLNPNVGKCDREIKCGYHYTPKQYFLDHGRWSIDHGKRVNQTPNVYKPSSTSYGLSTIDHGLKPPSTIDQELFKASLSRYDDNHLVTFLTRLFGIPVTDKLIAKYYIGTAKHWRGATVFWQVDSKGKARTGKIMLYNPTTGKRVKQPFNHITWVHKVVGGELLNVSGELLGLNGEVSNRKSTHNSPLTTHQFNLCQCFFGEHLLQNNHLPVAIVESEKTALLASVLLPQFVWLAAGSLTSRPSKTARMLLRIV